MTKRRGKQKNRTFATALPGSFVRHLHHGRSSRSRVPSVLSGGPPPITLKACAQHGRRRPSRFSPCPLSAASLRGCRRGALRPTTTLGCSVELFHSKRPAASGSRGRQSAPLIDCHTFVSGPSPPSPEPLHHPEPLTKAIKVLPSTTSMVAAP